MFEVGKKYIKNGYKGAIFQPLYIGDQETFGKVTYDGGYYEMSYSNSDFNLWQVYEPPQKLTAWVAVYRNSEGEIYFGEYLFFSEQTARASSHTIEKIDVVEISYTTE